MINKHNFLSIVCEVFTCLFMGKIILEGIMGHKDKYYIENSLSMFGIIVVATLILSIHKYLQNAPVFLVMLLQYAALIGSVMGGMWLANHFVDMNPEGYRDMFWTVTIPYVVLAGIYYFSFFWEVKKANALLSEMNQEKRHNAQ